MKYLSEFENKTSEELYHGLEANALHGEANGLEIVLDAEQFNHGFDFSNDAGFMITLHNHLDKPMLQFSSQLILPGTTTQINLQPTISETTKEAISAFSPEARHCYAEGEQDLTYLTFEKHYRYEMNNCLIDQGIRDIIWNCRCIPYFADYLPDYLQFIPMCFGEKLYCANVRMKSMGMRKRNSENNITMLETQENPDTVCNN